mmetsp:Transcript_23439/g.46202  ORF Transcript_23439/g.46202 Transcript_23439/m.46202 type:complete len:354 (+) Transcript_23439:20-1081(+)
MADLKNDSAPPVPVSKRFLGTCKWFDSAKGFGFLVCDSDIDGEFSGDVFVHVKELPNNKPLFEGQCVSFELVERDKTKGKTTAVNVALETSSVNDNVFTGKIKWFDSKKGFGFITRDIDEADIFVHKRECSKFIPMNPGQEVLFEVQTRLTEKGDTAACRVKPAKLNEISRKLVQGSEDGSAKMMVLRSGRVKWYNPESQIGCIDPFDSRKQVNFHRSVVQNFELLEVNDPVEFHAVLVNGKMCATLCRRLTPPQASFPIYVTQPMVQQQLFVGMDGQAYVQTPVTLGIPQVAQMPGVGMPQMPGVGMNQNLSHFQQLPTYPMQEIQYVTQNFNLSNVNFGDSFREEDRWMNG